MQQRLIVEGNDAIALTQILLKRKTPPPRGYSNPDKYKDEFVISTKGFNNMPNAVLREIQNTDVKRIGIIIDANSIGAEKRSSTFDEIFTESKFQKIKQRWPTWAFDKNETQISIYVMPDNKSEGYLEHFFYGIIPSKYNTAKEYASEIVENYYSKDKVDIPDVRKQKAKTYAYLSLMDKPGLPFGTAVQAGYFDHNHQLAKELEDWFKHIFVLEED